ncbi:hypothetical protein WMC41_31145 (plasmid) [Shinella yambaruensis]|uniref:hypothetical protein n=1 Tax=Shinella TaxID=323620 RepID=UPI00258D76C4|nr:hypothetical protein [Shinella sp.]MCW5712353.1 hypothetical protein [Shinella sp.]
MTQAENNDPDEYIDDRDPKRAAWDVEVHLPTRATPEFISGALLHLIENKIEFGIFYESGKVVIAYEPGDDPHVPSRWSDGSWRIGPEPFDGDDGDF